VTATERSSVAVVGGGLVGATLALALAQQGFAVTLVDRDHPKVMRGELGIDIRNVALSPASQKLLQQVDIWREVTSAPYHHMCVWEEWGSGQIEFDAADVGRSELGWLVEMSPLVCAAWSKIEQASPTTPIDIVLGNVIKVEPGAHAVQLHVEGQPTLSVDFLLAADGAQSVVRQQMSLPVIELPVAQVALATVVQTEHSHQHTAWQRFLIDGPLALLPSPDEHVCSVVWSQSEAKAQARLQLGEQAFCDEIGFAIEHRLGKVLAVDKRIVFPLTQQRVKHCAPHPRVLFVGDAMRVIHPLAGQGVNLGLEDVSGVLAVTARQPDLGAPGIWTRFARQRQVRSQMMMRTMATLQNIYANDNPAMSLLRNMGVSTFNAMTGLKRQVMREAMGLGRLS
jgi:ubiquinone biosynthesis UbiH/UbiF/VisC/COQ6 family hydroxylase